MDTVTALCEMESIRAQINGLLDGECLTHATRAELEARLEEVAILRAKWEALHARREGERKSDLSP